MQPAGGGGHGLLMQNDDDDNLTHFLFSIPPQKSHDQFQQGKSEQVECMLGQQRRKGRTSEISPSAGALEYEGGEG